MPTSDGSLTNTIGILLVFVLVAANGFGRSSYSLSHAGPLHLASDTTRRGPVVC